MKIKIILGLLLLAIGVILLMISLDSPEKLIFSVVPLVVGVYLLITSKQHDSN